MAFLNLPLILLGCVGVLAPIVLHLSMRRKPQHAIFPALRFIRQHKIINEQKLQVRHWVLLALRCLGLLAIGIALARPIISSATAASWSLIGMLMMALLATIGIWAFARQQGNTSILGPVLLGLAGILSLAIAFFLYGALTRSDASVALNSEAPVAAVLLFDTSPRMGLIHESQSRLDRARTLARSVVRLLPQGSRIAVMDTAIGGAAFSIDRSAALTEIKALETGYASQSIPSLIDSASQLLSQAEEEQHELYIFSDLTEPSWQSSESILSNEGESERPHVYVLDVGIPSPQNRALGDLRLQRQHQISNSKNQISIGVLSQGSPGAVQVELLVEKPDPALPIIVDGQPRLPTMQLRDQQELMLTGDDESQWVDFVLVGLPVGTHHGQVRLSGSDGLLIDDVRYFSLEVHPPARVAVMAGQGAAPDFLLEALAPRTIRSTGQAAFDCNRLPIANLRTADLAQFDCVALLDPPPLESEAWQRLGAFVDQGGGLGLFLGRNAKAGPGFDAFNTAVAQRLLPGKLEPPWRAGGQPILYTLDSTQHPMLRLFERNATAVPWSLLPIERHWQMDQLNPGSTVVMRFSNGQPAIIDRTIGLGKIVVVTTPISDPLNVRGRPAWNRGTDEWPFVVLTNELFKYLSKGNESSLNYEILQTGRLAQRPDDPTTVQWFRPEGMWQDATATNNTFSLSARTPGIYRLKGTGDSRGFSANVPVWQSNLSRIPREQLDAIFGRDQYQIADNEQSINRRIGVARRGHEFYPYVMLFVAIVMALEHLLSNRFYADTQKSRDTAPARFQNASIIT